MNRHLFREILRQLGESGGAGAVAALLVFVATVLAGSLLAIRAWVYAELLTLHQPATITVALSSPQAGWEVADQLRQQFPGAAANVLAPGAVRAELLSWFPQLAGALATLAEESFPALLVVELPRSDEAAATMWLEHQPAVRLAASSRLWREPLQRALAGALAGGVALTGTLLAGCAIVVLLAVRLMVLAHADEIEIMRLIGARERDIRVPYLVSGAILGGVGSVVGVVVLLLLARVTPFGTSTLGLPWKELLGLVATGPAVGTAGALLGLATLPREP